MADDIWIYDPAAKKVENITNNIAQDIIPNVDRRGNSTLFPIGIAP